MSTFLNVLIYSLSEVYKNTLRRACSPSKYRSLLSAGLAVDLLHLKVFPRTKGCTTGVRFVFTFYRITFVHQDLPSPPGYLRVPQPSCQEPVYQDFPSPPRYLCTYAQVPRLPSPAPNSLYIRISRRRPGT